MTWLVTGGAGYIGSHVVRAFRRRGHRRRSCSTTSPAASTSSCPTASRWSRRRIARRRRWSSRRSREHDVDGVVHLAGFKYAGVSVERPLHTYEQNVTGTVDAARGDGGRRRRQDRVLLERRDVRHPRRRPGDRGRPRPAPESPYGESKLIGEWLLRDQARATGLKHTSLRYFNVVGSGSTTCTTPARTTCSRWSSTRSLEGKTPRINGDDYPTPDGTCVRDYIHVADLAVLARRRRPGASRPATGSSPSTTSAAATACSVREIMDAIRDVTGIDFEPEIHARRPGDPARIVASGELAARDLDWEMRHDLREMVRSAWSARQAAGSAYPG